MPDRPPVPSVTRGATADTFLALLNGPWARALPGSLRRSRFLAYLYGLHAHADQAGLIRSRDGCGDIADSLARASFSSLTDGGRFFAAALVAGVVAERQPGHYALVTAVTPDWEAASAVLTSTDLGSAAA